MICTKKDIPIENLFMVGIIQKYTTRDGFHIANPRKPFVVSRAEALNIIGYMITMADFKVKDVEQAVNGWTRENDLYRIASDDSGNRALIHGPKLGWYILTKEEGLRLCASLVHALGLKPSEIDACVMAIFEQPRGQETLEDMVKRMERASA